MLRRSLASLLTLATSSVQVYSFRFAPVPSTVTPGLPITVTWLRSAEETENFVIVKDGGDRLGSIATVTVDATPGQTLGTAEVTFFRTKKFILEAVQNNALGDPINTLFFDSQIIRNFGEPGDSTSTAREFPSDGPDPITTTLHTTITDSSNGSKSGLDATMTSGTTTIFVSSHRSHGLHPGAIAGIVIGCFIFILTCVWMFRYRLHHVRLRRRSVNEQTSSQSTNSVSQRHRDAGPLAAALYRTGSGRLPPAYQDLV